jgi:predicted RNA-binding Zn ribbon-like protein
MSRDIERALTQFFGGRVCLDFGNTLDWRTSDQPQELIQNYEALLGWCNRRHTMPSAVLSRLRARAASKPQEAEAVMAAAVRLREEIWSLSEALRTGRKIGVERINALTKALPSQPRLIAEGTDYVFDLPGRELEEVLWPILWSITALLTSNDAGRIGMCQAEGCGWFFVDESPNRSRLWCSSEVCGNRERARRSYAKRKRALGG